MNHGNGFAVVIAVEESFVPLRDDADGEQVVLLGKFLCFRIAETPALAENGKRMVILALRSSRHRGVKRPDSIGFVYPLPVHDVRIIANLIEDQARESGFLENLMADTLIQMSPPTPHALVSR